MALQQEETMTDELFESDSLWFDVARWVSDIGCPPVFGVVGLFLLASSMGTAEVWWWSIFYLAWVILIPLSYIVWQVKIGKVSDFHLRVREERIRPIIVIFLCAVSSTAILYFGRAPQLIITLALDVIAAAVCFAAITPFWKISAHVATASGVSFLLLGFFGWLATPFLLLIPIVAWARVYMRRHTVGQVVAGAVLGASLAIVTTSWLV